MVALEKDVYLYYKLNMFPNVCGMSQLKKCDLLSQGSVGLVPDFSVHPPVGHVCSERVSPLLPQNLLDQTGTGHVHYRHRTERRLPQGAVDLFVLDLIMGVVYWVNTESSMC